MACWEVNTYAVEIQAANLGLLTEALAASPEFEDVRREGDRILFRYGEVTNGKVIATGRYLSSVVSLANRVNRTYATAAVKKAAARAGFALTPARDRKNAMRLERRARA